MLYAGVDTHKKYSRVVVTDRRCHMVAQASVCVFYLCAIYQWIFYLDQHSFCLRLPILPSALYSRVCMSIWRRTFLYQAVGNIRFQ